MSSSTSPSELPSGLTSELESFRQQWLSDLRIRNAAEGHHTPVPAAQASSTEYRELSAPPLVPSSSTSASKKPAATHQDDDDYYLHIRSYDEAPAPSGPTISGVPQKPAPKPLVSALDHFEEAMEKEAEGNMGDSLKLYRQAYKLDPGVDKRYREKHFPAGHAKPTSATTTSSTSKEQPKAQDPKPQESAPQSIADLLASFSSLSIQSLPPPVEGDPAPPCPISDLPDEILAHILSDVALHDVAEFARLSLVCRRLAYLVASDQRIWRSVSLHSRFGFTRMHHVFNVDVDWTMKEDDHIEHITEDGVEVSVRDMRLRRAAEAQLVTRSLVGSGAEYPDWRTLFRQRPRIRFNGCYISTVNYLRAGQMSTNQSTWGGSPIHIVTYYRYLRFFRDGSVISLLTTSQPSDVVHHLTKDELRAHRRQKERHPHHHHQPHDPAALPNVLPSASMRDALKGRWRLSSTLDIRETEEGVPAEEPREGDLYIETEGPTAKHMYRMDLTMRSAGKGVRNNKLVWRGFYSYNKLTDDWGEFLLKNDKPFFFSRVKSYGYGE